MNNDIRGRILASFGELSAAKGLKGVTMDELAARAGISKRTLYRYFPGKEAVIGAMIEGLLARISGEFDQMLAGPLSPLEKIQSIMRVVSVHMNVLTPLVLEDMQRYYPHRWEQIDRFRMGRITYVEKLIIEGQENGQLRPVDPRVAVNALVAAVQATVTPDFVLRHGLTISDTVDQLFSMLLYGLAKEGPKTAQ